MINHKILLKNLSKTLFFLILVSFLSSSWSLLGESAQQGAIFPVPLDGYQDDDITDLKDILIGRIIAEPFNLVVSITFLLAIIHTFLAGKFRRMAMIIDRKKVSQIKTLKAAKKLPASHPEHSTLGEVLYFLGEVEIVLSIWVMVLGVLFLFYKDWYSFLHYLENDVVFTEPLFVMVIMSIAGTRPITYSAEAILTRLAKRLKFIFKTYSGSFWFVILFIGGLLGSFITEVAAITIAALLISSIIFSHTSNTKFKYITLGILLVNISIGGALTHFAAPVILIVADKWNLTMSYMLGNFGAPILLSTFTTTLLGYLFFKKEFKKIDHAIKKEKKDSTIEERIPIWIIIVHYMLILWSVINVHHPILFFGGYLLLLGFMMATKPYQKTLDVRSPLLIGLFLAGLIIHGGLQAWWIVPVLSHIDSNAIFWGSLALSTVNDNAGVTFLSSLIPNIPEITKQAVIAGALSAGGLTILANAPNPTAFSILNKNFDNGINHFWLFLAALPPTIIAVLFFLLL
ncbi:MAG: DUF1646 family protein [SAR324 cluster bacterium]|nr:DUF1646 family protein [SAR324 cluster bacterium]